MATRTSTRITGREIRLAKRPEGLPDAGTFTFAEVEVPAPADGQVLVRNRYLSVDPYMRGKMSDRPSYTPPYEVGEAMDGAAVGEVVESNVPDLQPGDLVVHWLSWREYAVLDAADVQRIEADGTPPSAYLGVLGMPGLTAWIGLKAIAAVRPGDTVFVSGAAGAVGSVAGQLARLLGAGRVIGSAGSEDKVRHLVDELGFDAAFDYKAGPVAEQLAAAAPDGIDVYFDNVGGEQLRAAVAHMNVGGRIAVCGTIASYNEEPKPEHGVWDVVEFVYKRISLQGFLVLDHYDRTAEFLAEVGPWVREGSLKWHETVVDGFENAPDAFLGLFRGDNLGKMVVRTA